MMRPLALIAVLGGSIPVVCAGAATVFRGLDNNTGSAFPLLATPNSNQARTDFLSAVAGLGTQYYSDIESNANGVLPATINFTGGQTAQATGARGQIRSSPQARAFGTHGSRFIYTEGDEAADLFVLKFNQPIRAVGFTWTDALDYFGSGNNPPSITVTIGSGPGAVTVDLVTALPSASIRDGSVGYFGIIGDVAFDQITVARPLGAGGTDGVGFDDITFLIPAPAPLAVLGLGLLAAGRRRR